MRPWSAVLLALFCPCAGNAAVDTFTGPPSVDLWTLLNSSTTKSFSDMDAGGDLSSGSLKFQSPATGSFSAGGVDRCVDLSPGEYYIGGQLAFPRALVNLETQIGARYHSVECAGRNPSTFLAFEDAFFTPYWIGEGWNDYRHRITVPADAKSLELFFNVYHAGSEDLTAYLDNASLTPVADVGGSCQPSATRLCLHDYRFAVDVNWEVPGGSSGTGKVVRSTEDQSALFWFFGESNWEIQLKIIEACSLNDRYWVFFSATTNQKFTVTVTDTKTGSVRSYLSPAGPPAPARTDTDALDVCP